MIAKCVGLWYEGHSQSAAVICSHPLQIIRELRSIGGLQPADNYSSEPFGSLSKLFAGPLAVDLPLLRRNV